MKKQWIFSMLVIALMLVPVYAFADWQGVIESMQSGSVNWSTGIIEAKGIGTPPEQYMGKPQARPMALRAAKMDAYRNLLEVIQGVRVDSTTLIRNYVVENDVIMARVEGLVKGAQEVNIEYMSDGTVEVTLQMSLNGGLAKAVLPGDIQEVEPIRPIEQPGMPAPPEPAQTWPTAPAVPEAAVESPAAAPAAGVFTGLVVDARGLAAKPAMSPKVLDEAGKEVYGSAYVSREYAIEQGMSGYAKQLDAAKANERVTSNPMTVKGLKTMGPGKSDIVISNADAAQVRSSAENLSFLKKCRVMIVVD